MDVNVNESELDQLFDSFEDDVGVETIQEETGEGFQKVSKYREIPEYQNQHSDVIISKDKRIDNFNNQVTIQGESDSQYIVFEMDRYYDGIDLNDKLIQIHYERPDKEGDNCPVVNVEMSDTKIRFGWVVPQQATQVFGILKVMPFAIGTSPVSDTNTYIIKEMYSEYRVYQGLAVDGGITKPTDEWYQQFVNQMVFFMEEAQNAVNRIGTSVEDTKRYRDETAEIASSISDISAEVEQFEQISEQAKSEINEAAQEVELSKTAAANSALMSKSYSEGGTGLREDEANKNAKYFMEQAQRLVEAAGTGGLIPAGTITFEEIPEIPTTGHMYNISNSFVTDDRFEDGAGYRYNSGVNVYWTLNGKLDVLSGVPPTKADIGLGNVPNVTTNDQTPTFERAETRENILSGEKLSVLFGKLSKIIYDLSEVAFSGSYDDLSGLPSLFSGNYDDLSNKPVIPTIPGSLPANGGNADTIENKDLDYIMDYDNLNNKPTAEDIGAVPTEAGLKFQIKFHNDKSFSDIDSMPEESEYGKSFIRIFSSNFDGMVIENSSTTGNYVAQLCLSSDGIKFRKRQGTKEYEPWKDLLDYNSLGIASVKTEITLNVSDWSGTETPFTQTLSVPVVNSDSIIDIDVAGTVTAEQLDAYINAKIVDGGQGAGTITLKAFGDKPEVAIPLKVVVRKV